MTRDALDRLAISCARKLQARQPRADSTINQLPAGGAVQPTDLVPLFRNGSTFAVLAGSFPSTLALTLNIFNVLTYPGVLGNGTNDDTAGILLAYAAAAPTGGIVFFPQGQYVISAAIPPPAGVSVVGVGANSTHIKQTTPTADVFDTGSGQNYRIGGFGINYVPYATSGIALNIGASTYVQIRDMQIGNAWNTIAITGNAIGVYLEDIFASQQNNQGDGFLVTGNCTEVHTTRCNIGNAGGATTQVGLHISNGSGMTFDDCDFLGGWAYGGIIDAALVYTQPTPNPDGVNNISFVNTAFDGSNLVGFRIVPSQNSQYSSVSRVRFVECWTSGSYSSSGVQIGTSYTSNIVDGVSFTTHHCFNNGAHGFDIGSNNVGTIRNVAISGGSMIGGNSQRVANTAGVNISGIAGTLSGIMVQGNRIGPCGFDGGGASGTQLYGVSLNLSSGNGAVMIQNNDLDGNVTGAMLVLASNAKTVISGNRGYNPIGPFVPTTPIASGVTWTNTYGSNIDVFVQGGTFSVVQVGGMNLPFTGTGAWTIPVGPGQTLYATWTGSPVFVVAGT